MAARPVFKGSVVTTDLINILDTVDVPIVVLQRDFMIAYFNEAAAHILDLSPSDIGRASRDISALARLPRLEERCRQVIADEVEFRPYFHDGYKWYLVHISPYTNDNRQVTGTVLTFTNVTALRASIDQAIYEREFIKAIINTVADPLIVLSADQRIQSGNRAFYTMFGVSRDETQGVPIYELGNGVFELAPLRKQFKEIFAGGRAFRPVEVDRVFTGMGERTLILDARPLSFPGHSERRILVTFEDITARKQTEAAERKQAAEKLRRSEADLLEAQRLTHTGHWKLDLASGTVAVSPEILRIFDVTSEDDTSRLEFWFSRIHPEDRQRVQEHFERCLSEKRDYQADYRIVLPDGTVRYQRSFGTPIVNRSGDLIEFGGTAMDVTERVLSRAELEKAFEEIKRLKDRLQNENLALKEEIDQASMFEEVVGASAGLRAVLSCVSKVAPTDSTVLLIGETGTGKELIARAVHKRSKRSSHPFVSVNCAAIPASLIASELFGHEKGAFTGASGRRLGRFELAEEGTIFLDEVGDLPAETQLALLRVLQEREFERVGGNQPIRANVRVIAATNRDLDEAIAIGSFRSDLFYRLNVFPIEVPPLRERKEDIPLLVEYFIARFARKAGKRISG